MRSLFIFCFALVPINMAEAKSTQRLHRRDARKMCVEEGNYDRKAIKKCVEQKTSELRQSKKQA